MASGQRGCMVRDTQALQPPHALAQHRVPPTISVPTLALLGVPGGQHLHPSLPLPSVGPSVPIQGPKAPSHRHRAVLVLLVWSLQPGITLPGLLLNLLMAECSPEKPGGSHCSFPKVMVWLMCHQCHRTAAQPLLLLLHSLYLTTVSEPYPSSQCPSN